MAKLTKQQIDRLKSMIRESINKIKTRILKKKFGDIGYNKYINDSHFYNGIPSISVSTNTRDTLETIKEYCRDKPTIKVEVLSLLSFILDPTKYNSINIIDLTEFLAGKFPDIANVIKREEEKLSGIMDQFTKLNEEEVRIFDLVLFSESKDLINDLDVLLRDLNSEFE